MRLLEFGVVLNGVGSTDTKGTKGLMGWTFNAEDILELVVMESDFAQLLI